jgi:hypothetical protein
VGRAGFSYLKENLSHKDSFNICYGKSDIKYQTIWQKNEQGSRKAESALWL